jgi:transcriptional accessory protein Tex/SPT6
MKPMYNVNEIVSRMNQGESLENIAAELTTALNEAKKVYDTEQENLNKQKRNAAKRQSLEAIVRDAMEWLREYYPDFYADASKDLTATDKDELMDITINAFIKAVDQTANMKTSVFALDPMSLVMMGCMPKAKAKVEVKTNSKSEDDILNSFLNKICQ